MITYIGFDSAWTDNPKSPGAISAVRIEEGRVIDCHRPELVSFCEALRFIKNLHCEDSATLVAIDQPIIVPNLTGMRPVERVAASLVNWVGGGVQAAYRGRVGMFCDAAPIWTFLGALGAREDPEQARVADRGLFLMEVFPALALPSLNSTFFRYLGGPRYNPRRKTFRPENWRQVVYLARQTAGSFGCHDIADWCEHAGAIASPRKADQDKLDAVICLLIALHWRIRPRSESMLLGDLENGYMVLPTTEAVSEYLIRRARKLKVPADTGPERTPSALTI